MPMASAFLKLDSARKERSSDSTYSGSSLWGSLDNYGFGPVCSIAERTQDRVPSGPAVSGEGTCPLWRDG